MYMLDSNRDGSCELIAFIIPKDALIILLFLDVIINQCREAAEIIYREVMFQHAASTAVTT